MPSIVGLLETALHVDDMSRAVTFFAEVLGLQCIEKSDRVAAFDGGKQGIVLLLKRAASVEDMPEEAGIIPGHDGTEPLHMAFAVPADTYELRRRHLGSAGVLIRSEWNG